MSESRKGVFTAHWTEDSRDNATGRGCMHQGGSANAYMHDGANCLTNKKKVCSESLLALLQWAKSKSIQVKYCKHCDSGTNPIGQAVAQSQDGAA